MVCARVCVRVRAHVCASVLLQEYRGFYIIKHLTAGDLENLISCFVIKLLCQIHNKN